MDERANTNGRNYWSLVDDRLTDSGDRVYSSWWLVAIVIAVGVMIHVATR